MQYPLKVLKNEKDLKSFLLILNDYVKMDLNFFEKRYADNFSKEEIKILIDNLNEVILMYNNRLNKIIEDHEYKKYLELKNKFEVKI